MNGKLSECRVHADIFLDVSIVARTILGIQEPLAEYLLNELMNAFLGCINRNSTMNIKYFYLLLKGKGSNKC